MINMAKPQIGDDEKKAVMEVMDSGIIASGPRTKAFEEAFAGMCTTKHAIATTSGTTALHIAMLAHKIGPGDEVITSAFTFIASGNSVLFVGARPVFVDIDPRTFNLDVTKLEAAITPKTKAILPVHLFGLSCEHGRDYGCCEETQPCCDRRCLPEPWRHLQGKESRLLWNRHLLPVPHQEHHLRRRRHDHH